MRRTWTCFNGSDSAQVRLIDAIHRQHRDHFAWSGSINRLTGSDRVRQAVEGGQLRALLDDWDREAAEFAVYRRAFLLYP